MYIVPVYIWQGLCPFEHASHRSEVCIISEVKIHSYTIIKCSSVVVVFTQNTY